MPRHVLICPDKFKGTLTARDAAAAIAAGWRRARPRDAVDLLPISDGGDGFGELLGAQLGARRRTTSTLNAAHETVRATWWWEPKSRTAIIESARVNGLAMLPAGRFHPFELDTFGLGRVLQAAARLRPRRTLVGVGGSATNDAGFGVAAALGWQFIDREGKALPRWTELQNLACLIAPAHRLQLGEFTVAVDVRNPLLGARGCSRVYGPQKGLRPEDLPLAERCLRRLAAVLQRNAPRQPPVHRLAGSGAAGGLGFGLAAFAGARIKSGFELFAKHTDLARRVAAADLVITGEGAIDETTLSMGKGVGGVAQLSRRARKPCLGLGGVVIGRARARRHFTEVHALAPDLTTPDAARAEAGRWLRQLAYQVAAAWPE